MKYTILSPYDSPQLSNYSSSGSKRRGQNRFPDKIWSSSNLHAAESVTKIAAEFALRIALEKGPVHYTAEGIVEKNWGRVGQMVLNLLDEGCSNALVGAGARSGRYR